MKAIDFTKKLSRVSDAMNKLPPKLGAVAVRFSKDRFRSQNWVGASTQPWKRRRQERGNRNNRATLVDSGRLKRSIRKISANNRRIVIGTDVPYAQAHNEGVNGMVQVKAHTRGRYSSSRQGTGVFNARSRKERTKTVTERTGDVEVKAHTKKMRLPERKFMGQSKTLMRQIERQILLDLKKAMK